jgi:segregation and condensation protein B
MNKKDQSATDIASAMESLLFVHGESISKKKLLRVLSCSSEDLENAATILRSRYEESSGGIVLLETEDAFALATNPRNAPIISHFIHSDVNTSLSPALLETLSIIAYRHPISRHTIEYIRGVDSSFALRNLLMRGLIERQEDPDDSRMFLYRPSMRFLEGAGISSISELPEYETLRHTSIASASESKPAPQ